jgi:ABC-type Zn uptake system ZnuABC Zn-binding protein ZnuA
VLRSLAPLAVLVASGALAAGCSEQRAGSADAELRVVATTAHLADFARAVGGDRVAVETILSPNADPHDYEPRPSDARAVAEADVVLQSGGDIDAWLDDVVDSAGGEAARVNLIDVVRTLEGGHEHDDEHGHEDEGVRDPHWWQDPRNVVRAVDRIRAVFSDADAAGAAAYDRRAAAYRQRVERLDRAIERCIDSAPAERRKLVTGHDAFGYFAARYGIEIVGSVLPTLSTSGQPSAGDLRALTAAIRRERVTTIFPEAAVSQRLERAVARDAGVEVGPPLYADTLGLAGSPGATYLEALRHDASAITEAFGVRCTL